MNDSDETEVEIEVSAPAPAVEAPEPPVSPVRTAEQWAEAKGMLPELIEVAAPFARADAPKLRQYNPSFWRYRAASAGWPLGKELTEKEFDAAVEIAVNGHQYR